MKLKDAVILWGPTWFKVITKEEAPSARYDALFQNGMSDGAICSAWKNQIKRKDFFPLFLLSVLDSYGSELKAGTILKECMKIDEFKDNMKELHNFLMFDSDFVPREWYYD